MLKRTQIGSFLLPIFLIGGILGPVMHSMHHAHEIVWLASEHDRIAEEINHVHSQDGSDLITPAIPVLTDDAVCVLCAPLVKEQSDVRLDVMRDASTADYSIGGKSVEATFNYSSPQGRAPPTIL